MSCLGLSHAGDLLASGKAILNPAVHLYRERSVVAQRHGDPRRWPEIALANADILKNPDAIQPGQRLRVPPDPSTEEESTYRVRPGDKLWSIASRPYGDGESWPRIQRANTQHVPDPHRIRPDQDLVIPAAN